ncbi:MAG TPA: PQQ-dependent sugar dehydrogenase [Gammaproteobacteria bacterium]|nr:PQQ-dependent sugar dehydrogenase [Gammaproteobacteria bacterium]
MKLLYKVAAITVLGAVLLPAAAQQNPARGNNGTPRGNNGTPRAPTGLVVPPLGAGPFMYKTAEGQDIRVVVLARGLDHPWSIAFLPNGDALVTERAGRLRIMHGDKLDPTPIEGVPAVQARGLSGLFDVALHPQFATNHFVYLTYAKPPAAEGAPAGNGLARGVWNGKALTDVREIFLSTDTSTVSRIAFGRDGMLYMSTWGDRADIAQKTDGLAGKVLRLRDDGTVPPDNPFVGKAGYRPEIYTLGHRSTLGLAMHPLTGEMWENENGPNGGDEINVLVAGGNYGWPLVSLGRTYAGPWQSKGFSRDGMIDPVVYWTPSIAVSGMAFYTGNKLPKWKGDVFVGGMRRGEIPGTGHLERILFNEKMEELRRETLLDDLQQRIRDVRQGPDELLYVLTDETDGAVLRIEPAN